MSALRPPRVATLLLRTSLPADWKSDILRDLAEMHRRRCEERGALAGHLWYWRQALSFGLRFTGTRLAGGLRAARSVGGTSRWGDALRGLRLAARSLARSPSFFAPAVLVLGLGLGASATLFTVVDGVLLEPLPLPDSRDLVVLCEEHRSLGDFCIGSVPTTRELGFRARSLESAGTARGWSYSLEDWIGTEGLSAGIADPEFFRTLGLDPEHGRLFAPDEIGPDNDDVLLLTHAYWVRRYGADPEVVGRSVRLDGEPVVIIGVLPPEAVVPTRDWIDAWRPLHVDPAAASAREWRGFLALGRLAEGASLGDARTELGDLYRALADEHVAIDDGWRMGVRSFQDEVVGTARATIVALFGAVVLLLLIGCANVANLVLARSASRRRELAVRAALGAGRRGVAGVIALESLLLGAAAAAVGGAIAWLGTGLIVRLAPASVPRLENVSLDGSVVVFLVALALGTVALFGLLPALRVGSAPLAHELTSSRGAGETRRGILLRKSLVVAEIALSMTLLFGGGLLARTLSGYRGWDPGFDRSGLWVASAIASSGTHPEREELFQLWVGAEEALTAIPGVISAATASSVPLRGGRETEVFRPEGGESLPDDALPSARWYDVAPGYFETLGLPIVRGRGLEETDLLGGAPVVVVNEAFARGTWPGQEAVGRWLEVGPGTEAAGRRLEVVGVVRDIVPVTPGEPVEPEMFWSNRQFGRWGTLFVLRVQPGVTGVASAVRETLERLDPTLSLGSVSTMEQLLERPLAGPRFNALLAGVFAVLAALLAGLGLYSVLAYAVVRESRSIGLRLAIGASPPKVVAGVLREASVLSALGVAVGGVGALAVSRVLQGLVHGVSTTDPATMAATGLALFGLALVAAGVPARRASRIDPSQLLREE